MEDGGQVSSYYGRVGYEAGSTSTATITGPGSKWTNTDDLSIGHAGTIHVQAGGQVRNLSGYRGGCATITGAGSQ